MKNREYRIMRMVIIATLFLSYIIKWKCPFRRFFGVPCPGCGMTRAIESALSLDFKEAFYYHPLFVLTPFMIIFIFVMDKFSAKFVATFWVIIFILFVLVYIYRLKEGII